MALKPNNNKPEPQIDMGPFQTAVNEAATRVRGLWLGYIALLAYLFISVAAVTHRDLLLGNPVNLPVLQVKLPLIGFFAVAPMFFLINHFFLLLQLFGLGQRLREFNDEIAKTDLDETARRQVRRKLDTFTIVQMLAGPKKDREQVTGMFQRAIAIITLVIAPIVLLLIIQLQFLPYQYELVTWMHRLILAIDLFLLWMFWPSIKQGEWAPAPWRGKGLPTWRGRVHWREYIIFWRRYCVSWWLTLAMTIVMVFASLVATFPGEIADVGIKTQVRSLPDDCNPADDNNLSWLKPLQEVLDGICETEIIVQDWSKPADSNLSWLKGQLFGELKTSQIRERLIPFSRAIDLADDKTLIDLDSLDKISKRHRVNKDNLKPWQAGRTLSLRNRNLRGAMFDRADLRNVDLFAASLQGASLIEARLQGALLEGASLQGASLSFTNLQGASLNSASLQGVSLGHARLQGASLDDASLQHASLAGARLQGASLVDANLQLASLVVANLDGALLNGASLQGASFRSASLQGALLDDASLQGASLEGASLQGASFHSASLQGASLNGASLQGASLIEAYLQGASLNGASLQGALLDRARLQGASLRRARLQGASLELARLEGASLNDASLQGASLVAANLQLASLDGARLEGASLDGAYLQGASMSSTYLWRAYGKPLLHADRMRLLRNYKIRDNKYLEVESVVAPQLLALSQKQLDQLESQSLEDVASDDVKRRITQKLERLSRPENDLDNVLSEKFWRDREHEVNDVDYQKALARLLKNQICDIKEESIYVAQGLIEYRFLFLREDLVPGVARMLLDAAEGRTIDCPSLTNLNAKSIDTLRGWAAERY